MIISDITNFLEKIAPLPYQESYDNCGLLTGNASWNCTGVLVCLDATEAVINEAIHKKCNLVISHHPLVFKGLKKLSGNSFVEQAIITAIKHDIAVYAIHTNLDNVLNGVNGKIADTLSLINRSVLLPREGTLKKLFTFVPVDKAEMVRNAIFSSGGGHISNYSECSFSVEGLGTFKPGLNTNPFIGKKGDRHQEKEIKIEVIFPAFLERTIIQGMMAAHPYEEVAYDIMSLENQHMSVGAGLVGELLHPMEERDFLSLLKKCFNLRIIRHSALRDRPVKTVALCGGAGGFLAGNALARKVDFFITADLKYHEFFEANGAMVVADIGHFESEQYTVQLIHELLMVNFSSFALLKTEVDTNPVNYFLS
ncbi:MAG: Nif3-like dinuclear metal center hexameric protein [Chitinophagaceae bacterium]